jgi:proteasome lid subunit RPN8/RPN11
MIGFLDVQVFEFDGEKVNEAYSFLRKAGEKSFEAVALFAGVIDGPKAKITEVILPEQTSYKLKSGLMYAVEGDELHRINVWLYKNNIKLIAQIHSHPTEAYHSETDDEFPIISTVGGLSIVVPNFAVDKLNYSDWAFYRLSESATWDELDVDTVRKIINIV